MKYTLQLDIIEKDIVEIEIASNEVINIDEECKTNINLLINQTNLNILRG